MVVFASVRIAIESRLGELRVLALIGATPAQMRRPFLYFGSAYGLGGGFVAIILIAVFLNQIEAPLLSLAVSYQAGVQIAGFNPAFLLRNAVARLGARSTWCPAGIVPALSVSLKQPRVLAGITALRLINLWPLSQKGVSTLAKRVLISDFGVTQSSTSNAQ
jgi:ABC-type lipoprotein release transport system permease subunit